MKLMCDQCGDKEATNNFRGQNLCDDCLYDIKHPEFAQLKAEFKQKHPVLAFFSPVIGLVSTAVFFLVLIVLILKAC